MTVSSAERPEPLNHDALLQSFVSGQQPRGRWRVGLEHEKLAVRPDGSPVPYEGPTGIATLLERLQRPSAQRLVDHGHLIGLVQGREKITVEPGGQFELSACPTRTVTASRASLVRHMRVLRTVANDLDIRFIYGGFRPFGTLEEVMWLPKQRYDIMRSYLPTRGRLGPEMMKRTATMQANFDYADEADAARRLRTANAASSIVTAMAASSPITEGKPNGYKSYRAAVWLDTDEQRCGLSPFVFATDAVYEAYTQWALDVPMFFLERGGSYLPAEGTTFRQFMSEGLYGYDATLDDWRLHLSTLFPEVRLKTTIEVRGADAAPLPVALGVAALWRGLLDDPDASLAAQALTQDVGVGERLATRQEVPRAGLHAHLGRHRLGTLAIELLAIARQGLGRLSPAPAGSTDDRPLLDPLEELTRDGRCPADLMLEDHAHAGGDPAALVRRWELLV